MHKSSFELTLNKSTAWELAVMLQNQMRQIYVGDLSVEASDALAEKFFKTLKTLVKKMTPEDVKVINELLSANTPVNRGIRYELALFYKRQIDSLVHAADGFVTEIDKEHKALDAELEGHVFFINEIADDVTRFDNISGIKKDLRSFRRILIASIPQSLVSTPGFGADNTKIHDLQDLSWTRLRSNVVDGLALLSGEKGAKVFEGTNSWTSFLKTTANNVAEALGFSPIFTQHHFKDAVGKVREHARAENPDAEIDDLYIADDEGEFDSQWHSVKEIKR